MARWKLMVAHYLNTPGEEWEYIENDRKTGRPIRHKFLVPRLMDPLDPTCWTNKWGGKNDEDGEIIVCHAGKGEPNDLVFSGDPTPDMVPMDDEAKVLSKSFEELWRYKPEDSNGTYSQSLVDKFQADMASVQTKPTQVEGLSDLVAAISEMAKSNAAVLASLNTRRA